MGTRARPSAVGAMKPRRTAVFTNLGRPRLGMSEGDVRRGLYPSSRRRGLLAVFAASGAGFIKSGPELVTPSRQTHKEGDSE